MRKWWQSPKAEPAADSEPEPEEVESDPWDTDDEDEDEGAGDEPEPDVNTRVESELEARVKGLRDKLAAHGLDLSDDGEPVIRDPKRFRDWARPAVSVTPDPPSPKAPEPKAEPTPQPVATVEDKDIWEMTPEQFRQAVREEAEKITRPMLEQMQKTTGLIGKKYVDEATQKAANALESIAPDYAHIVDHPQFDELYRQQLSNMPPEWLDQPQVLASTALGLVAWLDPDQMPERRKSVDERQARAAVNRTMIPMQQSGIGQQAEDVLPEEYVRGSKWLERKGITRVSPEDLWALDAVDDKGIHSIDAYAKAKRQLAKARGKK